MTTHEITSSFHDKTISLIEETLGKNTSKNVNSSVFQSKNSSENIQIPQNQHQFQQNQSVVLEIQSKGEKNSPQSLNSAPFQQIQTEILIQDQINQNLEPVNEYFRESNPNELPQNFEMQENYDNQDSENRNPNYEEKFENLEVISLQTTMDSVLEKMDQEHTYPFGMDSENPEQQEASACADPYCFMRCPKTQDILAVCRSLRINTIREFVEYFYLENEKYPNFLPPLIRVRFPQKNLAFQCPCVKNRTVNYNFLDKSTNPDENSVEDAKNLLILQKLHKEEMKKTYVVGEFVLPDHVYFELLEQINRLVFEANNYIYKDQQSITTLEMMIEELEEDKEDTEKDLQACVPFGVPEIDNILVGGGLQVGKLTEIYGSGGSGKTQLCLNMIVNSILPKEMGGMGAERAFYITSDCISLMMVGRMAQIIGAKYDLFMQEKMIQQAQQSEAATTTIIQSPPREKRRRISSEINQKEKEDEEVEKAYQDLQKREQFITSILEKIQLNEYRARETIIADILPHIVLDFDFKQKNYCRVVVIDSIASIFKSVVGSLDRSVHMVMCTQFLKALAEKHEFAVVFVNEVVNIVKNEGFAGRKVGMNTPEITPSLGLPWSNLINQRLFVTKTKGISDDKASDGEREISVEKSSCNPKVSARFRICESGVVGAESPSTIQKRKRSS